ncbi:hypothetical protein A3A36_02760 [Candidatus Kaiserbacteria bacterium RIFCSPLOWO2_01_FULL_52_12b]|uniref:Uncharacterized protein n=1 Tax=Candidatus Kaiserbacteria bacterium RIFCSPLOWO2_01_FULL_52_12b TaxID=1798509 RepID=A0A1F6EWR4_9BACT|nr:MAG: hypothetical protein A3A36_02760 [Candidatus Kaiserbacteria bacterium RIFCSPLOWO2_01_FULL_52_12b]
MRRTFIILAIVIVLAGIGVGVYFYFFAGAASVAVAPSGTTSLPTAGQTTTSSTGTTPTTTTSSSNTPTTVSARLVQISKGPVVPGEVVVNIPAPNASSSPEVSVHYIERQSGNVFSYSVRAKKITRTSNRTVPGIQSASWLPDASVAFVRYLSGTDAETINTYALPANGSSGFFLPKNLSDISVSSTNILTLTSGVNGSAASLERTDGTRPSTVFTTPLSALRISFAGKSRYLAFTKPTATLPGNAFLVDSAGRFSRIAGPLSGLVALPSSSGKWVLISYTLNNAMQLELVNTDTSSILPLPVATIADKCAWAADDSAIYCGIPIDPPATAVYPDDWYQGAVTLSDRIWKIDVAGRYAQLVLDFENETENSLDAKALALDAAGTVLVFMNKNDSSLWSYSL